MELTDQAGNPIRPKVVTLEEIIAKETWGEDDIELLIAYQDGLDDETLERLGIMEIKPKTPDEVEEETKAIKNKKAVVKKVAAKKK